MAFGGQVEKPVTAIALTNERAGLRLKLKPPFPLHRVAAGALEINNTDRCNGLPHATASDAKGFPLPMRIRLFLLGKKIDYSAHDQNAPGATWKHGTPLARHMATTLFRSSNTATRRRRS